MLHFFSVNWCSRQLLPTPCNKIMKYLFSQKKISPCPLWWCIWICSCSCKGPTPFSLFETNTAQEMLCQFIFILSTNLSNLANISYDHKALEWCGIILVSPFLWTFPWSKSCALKYILYIWLNIKDLLHFPSPLDVFSLQS